MQPDELRSVRKAMKMTQGELGEAIGLSRVTVGLMERGEAPIERRTALAVRFLGEHPEARTPNYDAAFVINLNE